MTAIAAAERAGWLAMDDEALVALCEVSSYRGSGPGGQHRNTSDTAVRLRFFPADVVAAASERRSRKQNQSEAIHRLRHAIALQVRCLGSELPESVNWQTSLKNRQYASLLAVVLDCLMVHESALGDSGRALGLSTGKLVRFLYRDSAAWQVVNRWRIEHGLHPLKAPR